MSIEISCSYCGEQFQFRNEAAGKSLKCKVCGRTIRVPDGAADLDDYEERPRRRPSRSSSGADKTLAPAIGLYVSGLVGLLGGLFLIFAVMVADEEDRHPDPGTDEVEQVIFYVMFYGLVGGLPLASVVVLVGAVCLHTHRAYPLAFIGCLTASIPCISPCMILGVPFGIWGLITLVNDDVKRAFQ
jgi:hypothetical protein